MKELYLDGKLFSRTEEEFLAIEKFHYKAWMLNGEAHRDDGPAILTNYSEEWYKNGLLHRDDGPALIWSDGRKVWYFEDDEINDSFNKFFPMKNFIKDKFPGE